jgi:phage-related protein
MGAPASNNSTWHGSAAATKVSIPALIGTVCAFSGCMDWLIKSNIVRRNASGAATCG